MPGAISVPKMRIYLVRVGLLSILSPDVTPPVGLLYLAAHIRKRFDAEIRVVDQRCEGWSTERLLEDMDEFGPDIVGLSYMTDVVSVVRSIVSGVRRSNPGAFIVLGGPHPSAARDIALQDSGADALVAGEGELAFEQIVDQLTADKEFEKIPGLIWRERDGQVITNDGQIPRVEDLDSLPFPAYDLIDLTKYWHRYSFVLIPRRQYISLMSSRGCPFGCYYCHNIFGKRFRSHSPERVVDELEFFTRTYGVKEVEFLDDIFNHDHERAIAICDLIRKRGIKVKIAFPNGVRTDALSEELIEALVDTGLYYCSFALESGSRRVQNLIGKHMDIDNFVENVRLATEHGVFANGYSMMGFPEETEEDMKLTIDTMCESQLHTGHFFTAIPFPGTALHSLVSRTAPEKLERVRYDNNAYHRAMVNFSAVPDTVFFAAQRRANLRFYGSPRRIFRLLRDYPQPLSMAYYLPTFLDRLRKGVFAGRQDEMQE